MKLIPYEDIAKVTQDQNLIQVVKQGCKILNIQCFVGITFVSNQGFNTDAELEDLSKDMDKQTAVYKTILYSKQWGKKHPQYSYYHIVALSVDDDNDIKKILKIVKLKAFL